MKTYRDYFDIDPDYISAIDERAIENEPELWKKFYPHETFIKLLKTFVNVLDRKQKQSIWVEGAYGTGKSHAVLTLKKLLDVSNEEANAYFDKYKLNNDLKNNFTRIKDSGKILTVHRYGSSNIHGDNDLVFAIQESIERALKKAGIKNQGRDSLREAIIRYLTDSENKQSFNVFVTGSYATEFGGADVDEIIERLKTYEGTALHTLMDTIFKVAHERQIRAFSMTAGDLADWITEIIKVNDLKAIVFIWDEFTEYFYNNSRNLTGFQELLELSQVEPFYFVLVTHVSESLFPEGDEDYKKINGRFVSPHSQIALPENIAFQLMGTAMEKKQDKVVIDEWKTIVEELADRTRKSRKIVGDMAKINDSEMLGILPIHPYTALLLKHISSVFDSNQRSMFDFIKNDRGDEIKGFQWFIDNYGPEGGIDESPNPLLTIDMLWEFFYDKGRDNLAQDVRNVLDYYRRSENRKLDTEEKRILKATLLLQAISQHAADTVDLFIPNEKNIELAFEGSDLEDKAVRIADKLVRDKVLFKKSLGSGQFQYNAYINAVSEAELDKFKKNIDSKSTAALISEKLNDETSVEDAMEFDSEALTCRYAVQSVAVNTFNDTVRNLKVTDIKDNGKIPAIICFAKDDQEATNIGKKIRQAFSHGFDSIVYIDATLTPFGQDAYNQYREAMANSFYQQGKDNALAKEYGRQAKDVLKKWKERIMNGEFMVYTANKKEGERATTKDMLESILQKIDKNKFPHSLEANYDVLPTMYVVSNLKLGVKCGVNRKTQGLFNFPKLENAFKDVWDESEYWKKKPNLLISKIKIAVDKKIKEGFMSDGRISIRAIYDLLKSYPYGFMPCNFSAFILGFILKEYVDGTYSWSDGLTTDNLSLEKLQEMVNGVIQLQITPTNKYKDNYIVTMTAEERAFNKYSAFIFSVPEKSCTSVEQTRGTIRNAMRKCPFPIWVLKNIDFKGKYKTKSDVIIELIDSYCGIANNGNYSSKKTDSDIANKIGKLYIQNTDLADDFKQLLMDDNFRNGMKIYLDQFEAGALPKLANEVGDDCGRYINAVRDKFDAEEANWVWNTDTADDKIREVILEYQIILESNELLPKNNSYDMTVDAWCDKCDSIHISYEAAKNNFGKLEPFMKMLFDIKKSRKLTSENQKQKFLKLLQACREDFRKYYDNQIPVFREVCNYYLRDFSDEDIVVFYQKLPKSSFTMEKSDYLKRIDEQSKVYRCSLGYAQLKEFWKRKTKSNSPDDWSRQHRMPILSVVPEDEFTRAKSVFATLNTSNPTAAAVSKAKEYLEHATFYSILEDKAKLDDIFMKSIIGNYAVMLTNVDEVKQYLIDNLKESPYDWYEFRLVNKKIQQMAEAKYNQDGVNLALEKINKMDVDDVKRYLKELIKDNMVVGLEIIKGK